MRAIHKIFKKLQETQIFFSAFDIQWIIILQETAKILDFDLFNNLFHY